MRRKPFCCALALAALLLLGGCAREQSQAPHDGGESGTAAGDSSVSSALSAGEAQEKALARAGLTGDQATFVKTEREVENGREVYDVTFYDGDGTEYGCEIDAATGEVLQFEWELRDGSALSGGETVTAEQARDLALAQVPGAADSDIRAFETDRDDGRTEYEGTIVYGGAAYEFSIDAAGGVIRHWEESVVR